MTGTKQLEMKLHEQADQLSHLRHEVAKLKKDIEQLTQIFENNKTLKWWNV